MSAHRPIQPKQSKSIKERYEMLRKTLAHYLLLQVGTFVTAAGMDAIRPAMDILTNMKAELKVQDIKATGQSPVDALAQNLAESMGETFDSDYEIETGDKIQTVKLDRCGCIESVLAQAERYGLSKTQARSIFCGTCISSYKKAAVTLDVSFKGRIRGEDGCSMSFSAK
jgi:hypothetical protein